ncbi:MAG: hypothetical protein K6F04_02745 [bacterium]|nr:hypothetical protein [bacterium]
MLNNILARKEKYIKLNDFSFDKTLSKLNLKNLKYTSAKSAVAKIKIK